MKFRFASFNMKNMGETAKTQRDFDTVANIIRNEHFDVVAFQEILSEGKSLEYWVRKTLPRWELRWAEPGESSDPSKTKDKRGEGYAFIWNTRRLTLASSVTIKGNRIFEPRIVNEDIRYKASLFARTPYYARFVPVNGGFFEFRLVNVHLHFGDNTKSEIEKRKEEFDFLVQNVYPALSLERRYGNNRTAYTIVMGDYNLNLRKDRGEAEKRINPNTYIDALEQVKKQIIATVQDELTTLKSNYTDEPTQDDNPSRGYSQNYDHFSFDTQVFESDGIRYRARRIDAVRKYYNDQFDSYRVNISDHLPICLELTINEPEELNHAKRNRH